MSWIDDHRGSGPWEFEEQKNKWGYLNNQRWSSQPAAVEFSDGQGNPSDRTDDHKPCGHWHRDPETTYEYDNFGPNWWYQPSIDIYDGKTGIVSMHYDFDIDDLLGAVVYDIATCLWTSFGMTTDQTMPIYGQPNCARLSSNGSLFFYTCCVTWNEAWQIHHNRLYRFRYGETPLYYDVFDSHWVTSIPYRTRQDDNYNYMDCAGDRVACLVLLTGRAGAPVYYFAVKVSDNNGVTFHTEYALPNAGTVNYDDLAFLRMSEDGIVWIAYIRADDDMIELWQSNAAATNFVKIWETNYLGDLGGQAFSLIFDVSDADGQNVTISLGRFAGGTYFRSTYYSVNYGVAFNVNNYNTALYTMGSRGSTNGQYLVIASREVGTANYGWQRSVNSGGAFNFLNPPIYGMAISFVDQQKHENEIAYVECQESFINGVTYQGILYSDDYGATWQIITSPLSNQQGPDQLVISDVTEVTAADEPQVWDTP